VQYSSRAQTCQPRSDDYDFLRARPGLGNVGVSEVPQKNVAKGHGGIRQRSASEKICLFGMGRMSVPMEDVRILALLSLF